MIPFHPFADVFRLIDGAEFSGLVADIAANGLRERIVVWDGQILDGRNRLRACVDAGVLDGDLPPDGHDLWISHFRRFVPVQDGDPAAFVLSLNAHRRHDSKSQIAWAVAELSRLRHGGDRRSSEFQDQTAQVRVDRKNLADAAGVSERLVTYAADAQKGAAPELADAVRNGEVSVRTAADIAELPVGEQLVMLQNRDPKAFRQAVRDLRANQPKDARSLMNSRVQPPDDLDYSPTPPWASRALLQVVLPHLGQSLTGTTVLEPACGEGHISAVLHEASPLAVWASDIWDYSVDGVSPPGWVGKRDYLADDETTDGVDWVITNSPFGAKAEAFALRALADAQVGVAMFVRLGWLASNGRYERLFSVHPPTLLAIFAEDVPLHMGRWEPQGSTASDYIWIIWIKDAEPRAPFWVPPKQRQLLALPGDVERFTAHPVRLRSAVAAEIHAASEGISISKAEAIEIIKDRYTGDNGQALADELGKPIATIRKWAWEAGVSSWARNVARVQDINTKREKGL